jgi:hypothetical protein
LAHVDVGDKTNEIPTIPEVIKNLDIKGAFVTIDAMGCQTCLATIRLAGFRQLGWPLFGQSEGQLLRLLAVTVFV